MHNSKNKTEEFIINEYLLFSINAGLQIRNKYYPIYNKNEYDSKIAKILRNDIKFFLLNYLEQFKKSNEQLHFSKIKELSKYISKKHSNILHHKRFRIGISQKIINLFLKYMWASGKIKKAYHFPVDNIIKSKIKKKFKEEDFIDWTEIDNIEEYKKYIKYAKKLASDDKLSLAVWELENWKRR